MVLGTWYRSYKHFQKKKKKKAKHNNNNNINNVLPESTNSGFLKINWKKDTYYGSIQSLSSFSKYFPFAGSSSHA